MKSQNISTLKLKKHLLNKHNNKCCFCDSIENLEFAHLKPTELNGRGRGRNKRIYDVKNNPSNYFLVCKDCHKAFDRGDLKIEDKQ